MLIQLSSVTPSVYETLLLSLALFILSKELRWKDRWKAWIPGLRMYRLGASLKQYREGMVCGVLDVLYLVMLFVNLPVMDSKLLRLALLLEVILYCFVVIYRLRLFMELLKFYEASKAWIIPFVFIDWLPLLIFGVSKKYEPKPENIREENWQAGSKPKEFSDELCEVVPLINEGLSIQIRKRTVRDFGKTRYLLKDIALNVPEKSLVLLLGGSGSGKTTMINAVIGYEKADATILLNGQDVYKNSEVVKHNIGFVPQQNLIRGKDTVAQTVQDAAKIRLPKTISTENKDQKIADVLELLGLSAGKEGLVSKKSGGQLRRICIATELITDPELFILDEPDSGLDGAISREIFLRLRQIADEGRIVIVITHTPDRVIDLFDKVIILARDSGRVGRLCFYGTPQEARDFFERDTMEKIVRSVNAKDEGGEGRADEMIRKYMDQVISGEGGQAS